MRLLRAALLLLALNGIGSGCGHLRPDPSPAAIDSNFPSAEGTCNGQRFLGLGFCVLRPGESANLTFQGYYQGTIRIDSDRCQITKSVDYENSAPIALTVNPDDSCVIDFVVSPQYPHPGTNGVSSLKGRVYVKRLADADQTYETFVDKIPVGADQMISIPSEVPAKLVVSGCGAHVLDPARAPVASAIQFHLSEVTLDRPDCLLEGAIIAGNVVHRFGWQVWTYSKDFSPLPEPTIDLEGKKLSVTGDPTVSIIALDEAFVINRKASFTLGDGPHLLRLMTVKGRVLLGVWDGKEFMWTN